MSLHTGTAQAPKLEAFNLILEGHATGNAKTAVPEIRLMVGAVVDARNPRNERVLFDCVGFANAAGCSNCPAICSLDSPAAADLENVSKS